MTFKPCYLDNTNILIFRRYSFRLVYYLSIEIGFIYIGIAVMVNIHPY